MFTGLIDHVGKIHAISPSKMGVQLSIETQFTHLVVGESIAVDGVCLTVTATHPHRFEVDLSTETLEHSIAQYYERGNFVNLERALKIGDALGGHFVSGHVDQTAKISDITLQQDFCRWTIEGFSEKQQNYLIHKGSLCVNGVSLTINAVENKRVHLMLIPHTLEHTTLKTLSINKEVNIEFDMLAKIIAHQFQGANNAKCL